jgi:site-specific DNA-methyltransferase (adenine-specific)
MWVWGSLRFFMEQATAFNAAGWRIAQEIVWEKHNGSNLHKDRFRRVHELAVQFYRKDAPWAGIFNEVQFTFDALQRSVHRRKRKPKHLRGYSEGAPFKSEDGGPRIQRSVIYHRSCHGFAIHETQKPVELLAMLIKTSCPPGGLVGDFFAGSGAAGEAALLCGRNYVGAELDPKYFHLASDRLDALQREAA